MFRRLAATILAVLVLTVVAATPALAKSDKPGKSSGPVASGPGSGAPSGGTGTESGGSSTGSGSTSSGSEGSSKGTPSAGPSPKAPATAKNNKKSDTSTKQATASPSPRPVRTTTTATTSAPTDSFTPASSGGSVVRASAAPAATGSGVTALLPAPEPMLLPDSTTNAAAPVDVAHSSSFPQALLALLIGVGVLSVGAFGTLLARRRMVRSRG